MTLLHICIIPLNIVLTFGNQSIKVIDRVSKYNILNYFSLSRITILSIIGNSQCAVLYLILFSIMMTFLRLNSNELEPVTFSI